MTFSPSSADVVALQSAIKDLGEHILAEAGSIGPSPFLLFSMGALGIGCVLINERLRYCGKPVRKDGELGTFRVPMRQDT